MALKRSHQDACKDLYREAVSSSREDIERCGTIEVRCSGGDCIHVSPVVLALIMPWIKEV